MNRRAPGIGLIGFGWMGRSHSRAYRNIEVYFPESDVRPRLVATADPVSERVETAVRRFGYQRGAPDWREVNRVISGTTRSPGSGSPEAVGALHSGRDRAIEGRPGEHNQGDD